MARSYVPFCLMATVLLLLVGRSALWSIPFRFRSARSDPAQLRMIEPDDVVPDELDMPNNVENWDGAYRLPAIHKRQVETGLVSAASINIDEPMGVDCSSNDDTVVRAICPGLDKKGRYRCIDAAMLCDGKRHCPSGEDENDVMCMFYKLTLHYIGQYGQTITRWILPRRGLPT